MANKRAQYEYNMAVANSKYLSETYGGSTQSWKNASTASLIGAELSDSYTNWANANLQADSIESRQNEISARADMSVANIFARGEAVQGEQAAAFSKAGVKLEGSAINVLQDTADKAMEAARVRQMESDFENIQLEVRRQMFETQAELAPLEFLAGATSSYAKGQIS
jgi:hypothetical protein